MNKAFEKILERLESANDGVCTHSTCEYTDECCFVDGINKAKEIVQEVAEEYNGGWIACSKKLPEENKDGWTHLILSIKTVEVIFGFWHNEEMGFCKHFRDGVCRVCGVIAWMPLPEPFKERD